LLFATQSRRVAPNEVHRISLPEAQDQAAQAANPLGRLGQLQVEAAKQSRLAAQGDYFPKISGYNMHLNKTPGLILSVPRPLQGISTAVPVNVVFKTQTAVNFTAVQPITPLFQIHQLVKIARADENIARAKAGMPVAATAAKVQKAYFALLIAQRELTVAEAKAKAVRGKSLIASASPVLNVSAEQEGETFQVEKAVLIAKSNVQELSATLNDMLGWPADTELDLVAPEHLADGITLQMASDVAAVSNPDVVEAEQNLVKARAGHALSKMEYMPVIAAVGGYANQDVITTSVLPRDFSYFGIMATLNIFDGGKREHGVKMRAAQVEMATMAVQLTKAKVAGAIKKSYFEVDRARQLTLLAQRMASAPRVVNAAYQPDSPEDQEAKATLEAEMFKAELAYREALAGLKELMGAR